MDKKNPEPKVRDLFMGLKGYDTAFNLLILDRVSFSSA